MLQELPIIFTNSHLVPVNCKVVKQITVVAWSSELFICYLKFSAKLSPGVSIKNAYETAKHRIPFFFREKKSGGLRGRMRRCKKAEEQIGMLIL